MSLLRRFRLMQAKILVKEFRKQDVLAREFQDLLKLDENVVLGSLISRYLNGDTENSRLFDFVHLLFWDHIIGRDYPLSYLKWLEEAYAAYDAENLSKSGKLTVRALTAEPLRYWEKPDASGQPPEAAQYPRFEAARQLMLGIAIAVERKTLGCSEERAKEGVAYLTEAVRLFRQLPPDQHELSKSDKFHMALALHMADWLLSEYADEEHRRQKLGEFAELSAVSAFQWVADQTDSWVFQYNVTEIYGALNRTHDAKKALIKAIGLNPRLACLDIKTPTDGLDEECLSEAPALRAVVAALKGEKAEWLAVRRDAYAEHSDEYEKNPTKGIKLMLETVRKTEKEAKARKSGMLAKTVSVFLLGLACLWGAGQDIRLANAKPIFASKAQQPTMIAAKPIFGKGNA